MRVGAVFAAVLVLGLTGCNHSGNGDGNGNGGGGHGGAGGSGSQPDGGPLAGGGGSGGGGDAGVGSGGGGGSLPAGDMAGPINITPADQVLTIPPGATSPNIDYVATVNGQQVAVQWTIDRGEIGQILVGTGVFSPAGGVGGKATITATLGGETATTTVTVVLQQSQNGDPGWSSNLPDAGAGGYGGVGGDGPAPPATTGQGTVLAGTPTTPDPAVKLLYPYDGTLWPRGLLAPLIAWDPATHSFDAVQVKLHEANFDYTGTFAANATTFKNLLIPQGVWDTLANSNGGSSDDVTVSLTFEDTSSGTPTAMGPYTMTWHFAAGTLKGTVYYNSYGTNLVVGPGGAVGNSGEPSCGPNDNVSDCASGASRTGPAFGAATLAIKPGDTAPTVVAGSYSSDKSKCEVCHTVSANGSTLLTQYGNNGYNTSAAYNLETAMQNADLQNSGHAFPALSPDGSWFWSSAGASVNSDNTSNGTHVANNKTVQDPYTSHAYDAATGQLLATQPTTPWDSGFAAGLPSFSPDGKHLSFNMQWTMTGGPNGTKTADGKSLAILDYDSTSLVFGNYQVLHTPTTGVDSWSSFLPTDDAVVFEHEISATQFGYTWQGGKGELMWTRTGSSVMPVQLANANGGTYLPSYGAHTGSDDVVRNYEPTVNPVVSGGYAWVVFTSRRLYANVATIGQVNSDPRLYHWLDPTQYSPKKLWVAAIDLNAPAGSDPSHPAFYLPGQELRAGNSRAYWTVDPCKSDGSTCETGDECCGGYCRPDPSGGGGLVCTDQQPSCSQEYEKCTMNSDCCGADQGYQCINGFCAIESTPIT